MRKSELPFHEGYGAGQTLRQHPKNLVKVLLPLKKNKTTAASVKESLSRSFSEWNFFPFLSALLISRKIQINLVSHCKSGNADRDITQREREIFLM